MSTFAKLTLANGIPQEWPGGAGACVAYGAAFSGTVDLLMSVDDGVSYVSVGSQLSSPGQIIFGAPNGALLKVAITGSGISVKCFREEGTDAYVYTGGSSSGGGGGGGGDASASNQATQITAANLTNTKLDTLDGSVDAVTTAIGNSNTKLDGIDASVDLITVALGAITGHKTGGTAAASSALVGGVYQSSDPTLTDDQQASFKLDANQNLCVNVKSATGVAQNSDTAGQSVSPVAGAVTTAAPSYTTAKTALLSLDLLGNLRTLMSHGKTIKSVPVSISADGELIAAVTSKRIKVIAYFLSKAGTAASIHNIRTNNVSGTILGKIQLQAQTGGIYAANLAIPAPSFLFATAAGEALYLDMADTETVTGFLTYFDDDAA